MGECGPLAFGAVSLAIEAVAGMRSVLVGAGALLGGVEAFGGVIVGGGGSPDSSERLVTLGMASEVA